MNQHIRGAWNKYDSHMNTTILSRRLQVCCACWLLSFSFFVNSATTKTVNVNVRFESFESFMSTKRIFLNWLGIWVSRHRNQTYFERYEFDINVVRILIGTCTYRAMLNWAQMNQSSAFQYEYCWLNHTQNYMSTYEQRKNDSLLISEPYIQN